MTPSSSRQPHVVQDATGLAATLRTNWSVAHLRAVHPTTPVEVSVTSSQLFDGRVENHETLTLAFGNEFIGLLDENWRMRPSQLRYHLAQCQLAQLPMLQADVPRDPPSVASSSAVAHLWLCIGGGRSSLHYDEYDGVLLVVRGHKRISLLPPSATNRLKPRAAHLDSANHTTLSDADVDALLRSSRDAMHLEANAGDAIFLPAGWWHRVDSKGEEGEDVTLAVNWWWTPSPAAAHAELKLRQSFRAAVLAEQERRLLMNAQWCKAVPIEPECWMESQEDSELLKCMWDHVQSMNCVTDDVAVLQCCLETPAPLLLQSLHRAAIARPEAVAWLLRDGLGLVGASLLGRKIQAAQVDDSCASRAIAAIDAAFRCVGDEEEVEKVRNQLLERAGRFADEAAQAVVSNWRGGHPEGSIVIIGL